MRITNDEYSPLEIISEILSYNKYTNRDTKDFFQGERSSHDWLVEKWADKIDVVLNSFRRLGNEIYAQQSLRDYGVDVRLAFDHQNRTHQIGFQIKSNREAISDEKKNRIAESMTATLKRQAYEASRHSGVDQLWIVLAFDRETHYKKVQTINAELLSGKETEFRVNIIDPRSAMSLLAMPDEKIDAFCTKLLCANDEVFVAAQREIESMNNFTRQVVLDHIGNALKGDRQVSQSEVWPTDYDDNDAINEIRDLENNGFLTSDECGNFFTVEPDAFPGLCALYFEGRVRHELKPSEASEFMKLLVGELRGDEPVD
ncbi:TPA: DUF4365 domain-containing protein [Burkholderia vietnamiensis]|nr:DUF4365 domain-containing protein [Burkholderia vietnamiensis]